MENFNIDELVSCARRELGFRRRVYPKWIAQGKIMAETAVREIELMTAILDNLENQQEPKLF